MAAHPRKNSIDHSLSGALEGGGLKFMKILVKHQAAAPTLTAGASILGANRNAVGQKRGHSPLMAGVR